MTYDPLTDIEYWRNHLHNKGLHNEITLRPEADRLLSAFQTYMDEGGEGVERFLKSIKP